LEYLYLILIISIDNNNLLIKNRRSTFYVLISFNFRISNTEIIVISNMCFHFKTRVIETICKYLLV